MKRGFPCFSNSGSPSHYGKGLGVRLSRSLHEDYAEVIVGYVARVAQREVRCDVSAGAGELAFAAVDAPHHGARLQLWVRAIAEIAVLDRAEMQTMAVAESDTAFLHK